MSPLRSPPHFARRLSREAGFTSYVHSGTHADIDTNFEVSNEHRVQLHGCKLTNEFGRLRSGDRKICSR